MAGCKKLTIYILLFLFCNKISCSEVDEETNEELVESESKDGKLEIIKQIKKVNEDGSYTIGYEADDGSFKIESRDVLGNIKGTYGYLDEAGEIKRVSYSTNKTASEIPKPSTGSVVQRIPRSNRTTSTTRRPGVIYSTITTQATPTSTTVIQAIPRRRTTSSTTASASTSTTTEKAKIQEFIQAAVEASKTTTSKPAKIVYATPASVRPVQYSAKQGLRSTSQTEVQKSEGQLVRPETVTTHPTALPLYRRLVLRNPLLDNEATNLKPVTEEPEVRGNLLRRQLTQERNFDVQQHVFNLQQSIGDDTADVYSSSVTTGTPRPPLFTTTARSKPLSTTTYPPIHRPTIRYPAYHRNNIQEIAAASNQLVQESTTTEATIENKHNTPNPLPVVQIPANRHQQEPLVAIRHPFHGGTILIPVSHLNGRDVHPEAPQVSQAPTRYVIATDQQYLRETSQTQQRNPEADPHSIPIYVRRLPPPPLRSIPVQVDENGFIREIPPEAAVRIPYPVPVPVTPPPPQQKYANPEMNNEVDDIMPPVSTRDFQKLLEQLIVRQSRLERISEVTNPRRNPELYQIFQQPTPVPYYLQRDGGQNVQYIQQQPQRQRQYISVPQTQTSSQQQPVIVRPQIQQHVYNQEQYGPVTYPPHTDQYTPNRRVARLLHPKPPLQQENENDYLPPEVREMLLLRMLQLAMNPALPLDVPDLETMLATPAPQLKKAVRNVQILGEEVENKRPIRTKRYWDYNKDSYQ